MSRSPDVPPQPLERSPQPGSPPTWGIVCLANDLVIEWALALFASLELYAPELPVRIVPYDDRQERLSRAVDRFGYAYLDGPEIAEFHALGRCFYPNDEFAARGFRKLAGFSGPFEYFFSLDTDVLLLSRPTVLCRAIEASRADLVHFDTDPDQVYRSGPFLDRLAAVGPLPGFNAGLFAARRGVLDAGRMTRALADLDSNWSANLVPNAEQPFLNVAAVRLGLTTRAAHELVADSCSTCWPAVGRFELEGESWRLRSSGRWDEGWRLWFAHWAGIRLAPQMPNRALWQLFRDRAPVDL